MQIKAQIVGNSQTIAKICNAEMRDFSHQTPIHELIRGSLSIKHWQAIDQRYQIVDKVQICNTDNTEWICKAIKPVNASGTRVTH